MTGGAVLLAAGFARRFGSDKRRHPLADGTPLLIASVRRYAAAFEDLQVVLRPEDDELAEQIAAECPRAGRLRCPDARLGMGHSLACGARAAVGWAWLFVALADMPWVRVDTLHRLREVRLAAPADAIVQPLYRDRPGHPVGFAAAHLAALGDLKGDVGARPLLDRADARVIQVPVDDPGVLRDLDRPEG